MKKNEKVLVIKCEQVYVALQINGNLPMKINSKKQKFVIGKVKK